MTAQTVEDRVTILLNLLGPEFADTLLAELPPERGDRIKKRLGDFAQNVSVNERQHASGTVSLGHAGGRSIFSGRR